MLFDGQNILYLFRQNCLFAENWRASFYPAARQQFYKKQLLIVVPIFQAKALSTF